MSIFEAGMLLCFGASWPFSVYKTWKSKTSQGKSLVFLYLVIVGYVCGIAHKLLYSRDIVIVFYMVNMLMVLTDLILCSVYGAKENKKNF